MALITLILGAGLGKQYGFPDGPELRKLIINALPDHDRNLREIIEVSTAETVDEIAARYPNHADQIRRIVTQILREREDEAKVLQNDTPNTYKLMLKQIAAAQIKGDTVKIFTFNYDRSLQYLLHRVNAIESQERRIDTGIITPIYGRLAPLFFEDPDRNRPMAHHDYGPKELKLTFRDSDDEEDRQADHRRLEQDNLDKLCRASNLFFIGEAKAPKNTELGIILENSDQIYFMGVGYHKANMEVLNFDFTKGYPGKIIAGTGFNLSSHEIKFLMEQYPSINKIESCDAFTFLKTKFDISDPAKNILNRPVTSVNGL